MSFRTSGPFLAKIDNAQNWRSFFARFTSSGLSGRFKSYVDQIVPVVSIGRELPDEERDQFGLNTIAVVDNQTNPAYGANCAITSSVDIRLERCQIHYTPATPGPGEFSAQVQGQWGQLGFGYASNVFNPFDVAFATVNPQIRPRIRDNRLTSTTIGVQGVSSFRPPFEVTGGFFPYHLNTDPTSAPNPKLLDVDFGRDGQVIPQGLVFFVGTLLNVSAPGFAFGNLSVNWWFRELR